VESRIHQTRPDSNEIPRQRRIDLACDNQANLVAIALPAVFRLAKRVLEGLKGFKNQMFGSAGFLRSPG